jgi:hypothetical protein
MLEAVQLGCALLIEHGRAAPRRKAPPAKAAPRRLRGVSRIVHHARRSSRRSCLGIPFCVEGHWPEHRAHGIACAQHMRDSLTIRLARAPNALRQRLHRRVAEQRKTCRFVARRPKLIDNMFGGLQTHRIVWRREQGSLASRTRDRPEFGRNETGRRHHLEFGALVGRLTQNQAPLGRVAAVIEDFGPRLPLACQRWRCSPFPQD